MIVLPKDLKETREAVHCAITNGKHPGRKATLHLALGISSVTLWRFCKYPDSISDGTICKIAHKLTDWGYLSPQNMINEKSCPEPQGKSRTILQKCKSFFTRAI